MYEIHKELSLGNSHYYRVFALAITLILCGSHFAHAQIYPGEKSIYHSYDRYDFIYNERQCIIVAPKFVAEGKPWIWRARFFTDAPQADIALLGKGFHLVYTDVIDLFGSPKAVEIWNQFYKYLTETHGFAKKAALEGLSRGGLIIYNWAIKNPDKVFCIYGDAPACDLRSWPGVEREIMLKAYGFTKEQFWSYEGNPVDNLGPLAKANVPILHVVGDADKVVPVTANTEIVEERYKKLGGQITVIHKSGVGHHPHSLEDPTPIVEFILKHVKP